MILDRWSLRRAKIAPNKLHKRNTKGEQGSQKKVISEGIQLEAETFAEPLDDVTQTR
jgi:hypothetical protein